MCPLIPLLYNVRCLSKPFCSFMSLKGFFDQMIASGQINALFIGNLEQEDACLEYFLSLIKGLSQRLNDVNAIHMLRDEDFPLLRKAITLTTTEMSWRAHPHVPPMPNPTTDQGECRAEGLCYHGERDTSAAIQRSDALTMEMDSLGRGSSPRELVRLQAGCLR